MINEERKDTQMALGPVLPLVTAEKAAENWRIFESLKERLLSAEDYQIIAGRRFIKRSGFRKIAVAFGISDRIVKEERIDRPDGSFSWRIIVEVIAPNGRTCIGVGACDSKERKFAHQEHDVYATSHTRSKSRAISDMVAGGVVSAEEVEATPHEPSTSESHIQETGDVPVENLPWQAFKEKRAASPVEAGWIWTDMPGAGYLVDRIQREGALVADIGGFKFLLKISGAEGQFLNRTPQDKKES